MVTLATDKMLERTMYFTERDSLLPETEQAIHQEWVENGGESRGEELREFHEGALLALGNMTRILGALQSGRDFELPPADLDHNDRLMDYAFKFKGEVTHYVYGLELVARLLFAQKDQLVKDRRVWLQQLLTQMTGVGEVYKPEVAKQAYAGDQELEQSRLANAIWDLSRKHRFSRKGPVLVGGVGSGWRVEGPAFEALKQGNEVFDSDVEIIGLDGRTPEDHYPGMQLRQGQLERMVEKFPDLIKKASLTILMGSVTSNMNLVLEQVRYWLEFAAAAKEGGFLMMNLAAIEPMGANNERYRRSRNFAQQFGQSPDGSLPINPRWWKKGDKPEERGARIQYLLELMALARFTKWRVVNFPPKGSDEWRELMKVANDVEALRKVTNSNKDAMATPFYLANEGDGVVTVRMDLICQHNPYNNDLKSLGAERILLAIYDELVRKQDPSRGA